MAYYGIIEEIWEVDYTKFSILVFNCKWVDNKSRIKIDESGFTLVDFWKWTSQVFYVKYPTSEHW